MQTQYASPRLLLEFYKGQKVPPLVKKYDFQTNAEQSMIRSRRNLSGHSVTSVNTQAVNSSKVNINQLAQTQQQLDRQISENRELRMIIKQLQENLERLTSVNGELITRVEELQKKLNNLTEKSDVSRRQIVRKTRIQIYKQVEDYLKISSEKFIQCLRNTKAKMNPILQNKIEQYLEEVLNINSLSVRKSLNEINNIKERKYFDEQEVDKTIKQIVQKRSRQKSNSKQRSRESQVNQYQVIFDKLNRQSEQFKQNLKKDDINDSPNWKTDSKPRRPKIFRKYNEKNSRSISREVQKKLDF